MLLDHYFSQLAAQGPGVLQHMYDAANYVVIDEVGKLPLNVANIYRRLTVLIPPGWQALLIAP
jgi:nucleoside-triphosphatase THEP1